MPILSIPEKTREEIEKEKIAAKREEVLLCYNAAKATNRSAFLDGKTGSTSDYIYPNQLKDGENIEELFYKYNFRVVSVQKKTKVGADGLMIEIAKRLTTHPDDKFTVNPANVKIITGMSNAKWEKDMIDKAPFCFRKNIFHHGKLSRADLSDMRNALIIIDEIDTGDKEFQVLHTTLTEAGILNVENMIEQNNRFVFISATMIKELYDLYRWGDLHKIYKMTIPALYIGHTDFLSMGIIKEFYSLDSKEKAEQWIQEDLIDYYRCDYRVHLCRVNPKTETILINACIRKKISFRTHYSTHPLSDEELETIFEKKIDTHIVILVKGLWRRANLIPDQWKLRVGATHELHTKIIDNNVQIQGLPGRMSGYWRDVIERGHKTGPHRTSIRAIEEYEATYNDPFGKTSYQSAGFKKKKGKVSKKPTMLSPENITGLNACALPDIALNPLGIQHRVYSDESALIAACNLFKYTYIPTDDSKEGFKETSLNTTSCVVSLKQAIKKVPTAYGTHEGKTGYRVYYPCYEDITKKETLRFVFIIRPVTNPEDPEPNPDDVEALEIKKQELQSKIEMLDSMCLSC